MSTRILSVFSLLKRVGFAVLLLGGIVLAGPNTVNAPGNTYFVANEGQWEGDFSFKCEVGSAVYYVTPKGMTVDFREFKRYPKPRDPRDPLDLMERHEDRDSVTVCGHVVQIHYLNANRDLTSIGEGKLSHYSNYFLGRDSTKWRSRVGHYQNIIVPEVWPGIVVEYRADKLGVETVYHVKPGADPTQIQMEYFGLDAPLRVDGQGNLMLTTSFGDMKEKAPFAFQQEGNVQKRVDADIQLIGSNRIQFALGKYNSSKLLTIDPLLYGTYLGSPAPEYLYSIAGTIDGGAVISGKTRGLEGFPTTPGVYDETGSNNRQILFCSKFGPTGEFLASTLFGSSSHGEYYSHGLLADSLLRVYIAGVTYSNEWPLTFNALDTTFEVNESYIMCFSSTLDSIEYCSYLGGNGADQFQSCAWDSNGNLLLLGGTNSDDFPLSPDAFISDVSLASIYLVVFNPNSINIEYSTLFGGSGDEFGWFVSSGTNDRIILAGNTNSPNFPITDDAFQSELVVSDGFVSVISLDPPTIEYCTFLGGDAEDNLNWAVTDNEWLYVGGDSRSSDFPISEGVLDTLSDPDFSDIVLARINLLNGEYEGSYFGGESWDFANFALIGGQIILGGQTFSNNLPVTVDAYDSIYNASGLPGEIGDAYFARISNDFRYLNYCTYLGGSSIENDVDAFIENRDSVWIAGQTGSTDLPITLNAVQSEVSGLGSIFLIHFAIDTMIENATDVHQLLPDDLKLSACPNPFNPKTTLAFDISYPGAYTLSFHNVLGQQLRQSDLGFMSRGSHEIILEAEGLPSGIFFTTLKGPNSSNTIKIVLLR